MIKIDDHIYNYDDRIKDKKQRLKELNKNQKKEYKRKSNIIYNIRKQKSNKIFKEKQKIIKNDDYDNDDDDEDIGKIYNEIFEEINLWTYLHCKEEEERLKQEEDENQLKNFHNLSEEERLKLFNPNDKSLINYNLIDMEDYDNFSDQEKKLIRINDKKIFKQMNKKFENTEENKNKEFEYNNSYDNYANKFAYRNTMIELIKSGNLSKTDENNLRTQFEYYD